MWSEPPAFVGALLDTLPLLGSEMSASRIGMLPRQGRTDHICVGGVDDFVHVLPRGDRFRLERPCVPDRGVDDENNALGWAEVSF